MLTMTQQLEMKMLLYTDLEFPVLFNNKEDEQEDDEGKYQRENATLFTLCRNSELYDVLKTIQIVEDRFNKRYHYDWIFLNDKQFTPHFIKSVRNLASGNVYFDQIDVEKQWSYPEFIDQALAYQLRSEMARNDVLYGNSESYRHMCRFQSGFFFDTALLNKYRYYWRIEPGIKLFCDINYDIFAFMRLNEKKFGFVISIYEYRDTISSLWLNLRPWLLDHLEYIHNNSLIDWILTYPNKHRDSLSSFRDYQQLSIEEKVLNADYNLCHYWSNFEVVDLDFYRSNEYREYFEYLDSLGGFFYERWGDAPIHSIAASLFLSKNELHWFDDVAYYHAPYLSCPLSEETRLRNKCTCNPISDFTFDDYSCTRNWLYLMNQQSAISDWESFKVQVGQDYALRKYSYNKS
ncbi:glycosyltransferase family 15 protein [Ascoidea rubescens DSM 1968]|uniref:Glycosyltransferase family 15 protein n=1 Tax=Ascoidea rubescens DSM 1968 TaxID=1344418 RepID=A0A1D2VBH1_9ASCO|nr:glycosyltransferase family 15 protein [Ascoidea rubescens DSM 1968]ODV58823.1 glycosyltransferase family 15 protein [Ascoidea rubescens DSM 1968]